MGRSLDVNVEHEFGGLLDVPCGHTLVPQLSHLLIPLATPNNLQ